MWLRFVAGVRGQPSRGPASCPVLEVSEDSKEYGKTDNFTTKIDGAPTDLRRQQRPTFAG